MDEGRLGAAKKSQNYTRKTTYVMNDIIKNRQEVYDHFLDREQQETRSRLKAEVVDWRRAVVRNKVLLQCLEMKKQGFGKSNQNSPNLGVYGGRPLDTFSRDIDHMIAFNHPKLRRLRKVEEFKQKCLKNGAILDENTVKKKVNHFFSEPFISLDERSRNRQKAGEKVTDKKRWPWRYGLYDDGDIGNVPDPFGVKRIPLKKLDPISHLLGLASQYSELEQSHTKGSRVDENNNVDDELLIAVMKAQPLPGISSGTSDPLAVTSEVNRSRSSPNDVKYGNATGRNADIDRIGESSPVSNFPSDSESVALSSVIQSNSDNYEDDSHVDPARLQPDVPERPTFSRMKTLILPPITASRDSVRELSSAGRH